MIAKILDFEILIQCQSDVLSESLIILVNSTAHNIAPISLISEFNATINQTGYDTAVQCIWSANGMMFLKKITLYGNSYNAVRSLSIKIF